MNRKQTIELVLAVGLIVALCFAVIFPALYEDRKPDTAVIAGEEGKPPPDEEKTVLPKLKGISWESPERKAPEKKTETPQEKERPEAEEKEAVSAALAAKPAQEPLLELQEAVWYEQGGYAVVVGSVKNISDRSLPSVRIHASFIDEDQRVVVSEHSLIDMNPIFPGQVSSFSVTARFNPLMKDVVVDFRKFSGEKISWSKLEVEEETEEGAEELEDAEAGPEGELFQEPEEALR